MAEVTVAYVDGGLIMTANRLLRSGGIDYAGVCALEALAEAVVLYDHLVVAFNLVTPINESARQVQTFLDAREAIFELKHRGYAHLRKSSGANSGLAFAWEETSQDIAGQLCQALRNTKKSGTECLLVVRRAVRQNLLSRSNFMAHVPEELDDMQVISRRLRMDLVLAPVWQALYYPDASGLCVGRSLYAKMAQIHKTKVERLLALVRPRAIYIPPLLSLALDKSTTREDLLPAVWQLRDDFTPYRVAANTLQARLSTKGTLRDQLEALDEYEAAIEALGRRAAKRRRRWTQVIWSVFREVSPMKIARTALDKLLSHDIESQRLSRVEGFYDIWSRSLAVKDYSTALERVFGEMSDITTDPLATAVRLLGESLNGSPLELPNSEGD